MALLCENYTKAVLENQNTQSIKPNEDKNIFNPIEKKLEEMKKEERAINCSDYVKEENII